MEAEIRMSYAEYRGLVNQLEILKLGMADENSMVVRYNMWNDITYYSKDEAIKELIETLSKEVSKRIEAETELIKMKKFKSWWKL